MLTQELFDRLKDRVLARLKVELERKEAKKRKWKELRDVEEKNVYCITVNQTDPEDALEEAEMRREEAERRSQKERAAVKEEAKKTDDELIDKYLKVCEKLGDLPVPYSAMNVHDRFGLFELYATVPKHPKGKSET